MGTYKESGQTGSWKDHVIAAILLMAFAFFINRGIEIKGLYMDDLYMWSCFGEQSFQEFVFPIGGTRCRPVFYLVSWLEMALMGVHIQWMVPINILLNGAVAVALYGMARKISRSGFIGFLSGILYLVTRLSYYQISQGWGVMETMALFMGIGILYCLFRFLNIPAGQGKGDSSHKMKEERRIFLTANILYFLVCFVHERYMVLFPLFFIVLLMRRMKDKKLWIQPVVFFVVMQLIRLFAIGGLSPAGTGGTQVSDTFSVKQSIKFACSQVAYLFGINAGPEHLNGIRWEDTALWVHGLVYASMVMILMMVLCFVVTVARHKEDRIPALFNSILFVCFIGACIVSSSVTIRVEMRWVYVSFTAAVLYLGYMYGVIVSHVEETKALKKLVPYGLIFAAYVGLMIPVETYYRGFYEKLYYWPNQLRYNSLAEETYERYGDALFDKTIYIIGNTYEMSEFTADTFFKVYDKDRLFTGPEVVFIHNMDDVGLITDQMVILREEPEFNGYQDITQFVKDLKCQRIYGYYEDGWMDEEALVKVKAGASGVISLEMVYPGNLTGLETSSVYVDGRQPVVTGLKDNIMTVQIQVEPYELAELRFENNFYLEGALEQRGEKRFSMLVTISAD